MRAIDNAASMDAREPLRTATRSEPTDTLPLPTYPVGATVWMADLPSVREMIVASTRRERPIHQMPSLPFLLGPEVFLSEIYHVVEGGMISATGPAAALFATEDLAERARKAIDDFATDCEGRGILDFATPPPHRIASETAASLLQWLMAQPIGSYQDWLVIHARLWAAIRLDERAHPALDSSKASGGAA